MGVFIGMRGWLEAAPERIADIKKVVGSPEGDNFYYDQWVFPSGQRNWTGYAFFGCDIREQALQGFLDALRRVALLPSSDDEEGGFVVGYFLASHEVLGMTEYQVRDGSVISGPVRDELAYLGPPN